VEAQNIFFLGLRFWVTILRQLLPLSGEVPHQQAGTLFSWH
jgi:hypothetical protein